MDAPVTSEARLDFAAYVAERRTALLRAACAITRDRDTAEDLLQTALAGVFSHWDRIRDHRAADAYVRRAMTNQHVSWHRQPWRSAEQATSDVPEPCPRWAGQSPEPALERQGIWPLVNCLPPRQRQTVVLRYYEDLSEAETAAVLGCSIGTVKSSTSRGLATLRARLTARSEDAALAG